MNPIRYENDVAIFTTDQLDIWGEPGPEYEKYLVIESPPELICSFQYYAQSQMKFIHRYNRFARFKKTLFNLLGDCNIKNSISISLNPAVLGSIKTYVSDTSTNSYEEARKILKHYNLSKWSPYIPTILKMTKKPEAITIDKKHESAIIENVLKDFKVIERRFFYEEGFKGKRIYCPNLKFIAIKLLEKYGATNNCIPLLRTKRKLVDIEKVFASLLK